MWRGRHNGVPCHRWALGDSAVPRPARGMLRDAVSWELLCVAGGGCWRGLGLFWEVVIGVGGVELAQQRESPPMLLFGSRGTRLQFPKARTGPRAVLAAVRRFLKEQSAPAERQGMFWECRSELGGPCSRHRMAKSVGFQCLSQNPALAGAVQGGPLPLG